MQETQEMRFDPWVGKIPWRRKWPPAPVFLPGDSQGQRSLVGDSPWGRRESDMTERLSTHGAKLGDMGGLVKWLRTPGSSSRALSFPEDRRAGGGGLWTKMNRSRATMPARGWVRTVRAIGLKIHKILVTKRS